MPDHGCLFCEASFPSVRELGEHQRSAHPERFRTHYLSPRARCKTCGASIDGPDHVVTRETTGKYAGMYLAQCYAGGLADGSLPN